ncbi:WecB/TagA/CpsF family glycosyltransferase [Zoogloea sp.]|uniref:WecB/TagA/CpsF family glycosyltransferase n=1 Tax=Zoogloea sp. TaxID=49181 RepID=UPI0035B4B870
MTENMLGYMVDVRSRSKLLEDIYEKISSKERVGLGALWLACINPHSYAEAKKDRHFSEALKNADWLIPDGAGVVLASRLLGGSIEERVTGSDIFFGVLECLNQKGGGSVFFMGASEETLAIIRKKIAIDYPRVRLAGTYSPPFKPSYSNEEIKNMITAINSAAPDVLWVGMTAPKQEKWIFDNRSKLNVRFIAAIGAVFDFYSGKVRRSHPVFQKMGLEWLPRLVQQPRRLWRRMLVSAPIFLWDVFLNKRVKKY